MATKTRTKRAMHDFRLILAEGVKETEDLQGRLIEAGCDDASLWSEGAMVCLEFSRAAESLGDAIGSAVKDVMQTGMAVAHIELESRG
jgi:hypothetical protein